MAPGNVLEHSEVGESCNLITYSIFGYAGNRTHYETHTKNCFPSDNNAVAQLHKHFLYLLKKERQFQIGDVL